MGSGVFFAPLGFVGALKFNRSYVLGYLLYSCVQVVLTLSFTFSHITNKGQIAAFLLSAAGESVVCYYLLIFFRRLPTSGVIRA